MTIKEYLQNLMSGGRSDGSGTDTPAPEANGVKNDDNTQKTKLQEALDFLKDSGILKINEKSSDEQKMPVKNEKQPVDTSKVVIGGLCAIIVVMLFILIIKRR